MNNSHIPSLHQTDLAAGRLSVLVKHTALRGNLAEVITIVRKDGPTKFGVHLGGRIA